VSIRRHRSGVAPATLVLGGLFLALLVAAAPAAEQNPIQRENALPGTAGWGDGDWRDSAIQGYASESSVGPGDTLHLHVSTPQNVDYQIEIFRLGWYGGVGGRLVACLPSCVGYHAGLGYGPAPPDPVTGEVRLAWPVTDTLVFPVTG
jgi:hypothetical protein